MKTETLLIVALSFAPPAFLGCMSRAQGSSSPLPEASLTPDEPVGPTALVPRLEERSEVEVYLGLHTEISAKDMGAIVARIRKEGRFCGQGCGSGPDENGKACGAFWDGFLVPLPEEEKGASISLVYLQNETGLNTVSGDGFEYRLRQGFFHRTKLPKRKKDAPR